METMVVSVLDKRSLATATAMTLTRSHDAGKAHVRCPRHRRLVHREAATSKAPRMIKEGLDRVDSKCFELSPSKQAWR